MAAAPTVLLVEEPRVARDSLTGVGRWTVPAVLLLSCTIEEPKVSTPFVLPALGCWEDPSTFSKGCSEGPKVSSFLEVLGKESGPPSGLVRPNPAACGDPVPFTVE